ncbi:hypothetical protein KCTCHS21_18650 [Cohnella abietis]|uniref:Uncharacterized protein n=1 Tax=Cohnella abietis TaxID=2507935 RepID=A0A3T1D2Y2_9BACL|nr:hypothetical protein KCTCHS21_18650 [Cohnella abietis]
MRRYECLESFYIDKKDDNGFSTDSEIVIEAGGVWTDSEEEYRFVGGEVRLETADGLWIELPRRMVNQYFKEQ